MSCRVKFFTLKYGCKIITFFRIFDHWSCFISLISHLGVQFNQSLCRLFESRKGLTPQLLLIFHTPFLFPRLLKRDHCVIFRGWLIFFVLQKIEDNHVYHCFDFMTGDSSKCSQRWSFRSLPRCYIAAHRLSRKNRYRTVVLMGVTPSTICGVTLAAEGVTVLQMDYKDIKAVAITRKQDRSRFYQYV